MLRKFERKKRNVNMYVSILYIITIFQSFCKSNNNKVINFQNFAGIYVIYTDDKYVKICLNSGLFLT